MKRLHFAHIMLCALFLHTAHIKTASGAASSSSAGSSWVATGQGVQASDIVAHYAGKDRASEMSTLTASLGKPMTSHELELLEQCTPHGELSDREEESITRCFGSRITLLWESIRDGKVESAHEALACIHAQSLLAQPVAKGISLFAYALFTALDQTLAYPPAQNARTIFNAIIKRDPQFEDSLPCLTAVTRLSDPLETLKAVATQEKNVQAQETARTLLPLLHIRKARHSEFYRAISDLQALKRDPLFPAAFEERRLCLLAARKLEKAQFYFARIDSELGEKMLTTCMEQDDNPFLRAGAQDLLLKLSTSRAVEPTAERS